MKKPKTKTLKLDYTEVRNLLSCIEVAESECAYVDGQLLDRLEVLLQEFEKKPETINISRVTKEKNN